MTHDPMSSLRGTVQEAQEIVNRARMWRWKPYGEVTIRYAQDGNGAPVDLMQVCWRLKVGRSGVQVNAWVLVAVKGLWMGIGL